MGLPRCCVGGGLSGPLGQPLGSSRASLWPVLMISAIPSVLQSASCTSCQSRGRLKTPPYDTVKAPFNSFGTLLSIPQPLHQSFARPKRTAASLIDCACNRSDAPLRRDAPPSARRTHAAAGAAANNHGTTGTERSPRAPAAVDAAEQPAHLHRRPLCEIKTEELSTEALDGTRINMFRHGRGRTFCG